MQHAASSTDHDEAVRTWLQRVIAESGLKPTPFAREAGLAPSTLLRALDPHYPGSLEMRSIYKIVDRFKVPLPGGLETDQPAGQRPNAFHEPELVRYDAGPDTFADIEATATTQGIWEIRTRALEMVGYFPGDLVLADAATPPRPRDIVVAQMVDHTRDTAETVIRLYDPPYLMTETADPSSRRKPVLVDNDRVAIWGVVVRSLRKRTP